MGGILVTGKRPAVSSEQLFAFKGTVNVIVSFTLHEKRKTLQSLIRLRMTILYYIIQTFVIVEFFVSKMFIFKGTVILMQKGQCLIYKCILQTFNWSNNVEEIVDFLDLILKICKMFPCSKTCANLFFRETTIKNNQFSKLQTLIHNSCLIRQSFYGYRCKSDIAMYLHTGSLEITFTVPLNNSEIKQWKIVFDFK